MQIPEGVLPQGWLLLADGAYAAIVIAALYLAPWQRLRQKHLLNVYLGTGVALMVLWRIGAAFADRPGIQLLGITTVTLMFGWELAVLCASLALLGIALSTTAGWQTFAVNALVTGALPAAISYTIYRFIDQALPNHIFVYIFLAAFAGAGAAMALSNFATISILAAAGIYPGEYIVREFLPVAPLTSLPEAVLNSMVMTLLVFYRPQWVSTLDQERYIKGR